MAIWEFPTSTPVDVDVEITSGSITIIGAPTDKVMVRATQAGPGASGAPFPPGLPDLRALGHLADDLGRLSDVTTGLGAIFGSDGPGRPMPDVPMPATPIRESDAADLSVEFNGGHLIVTEPHALGMLMRRGGIALVIEVPAGSRCAVRATAADLDCQGEIGALDARNSSGAISAARVRGSVQANTMSGQVAIGEADGEVEAHTASGLVSVGRVAADVTATTASGDIRIGAADGSVTARTASGRVSIESVARGQASVTTASGDVKVGVVHGTGVYLDLSSVTGRVSSDLEPSEEDGQAELRLTCRTVTGALHVARARYAERI
jgi:Putative adhesin